MTANEFIQKLNDIHPLGKWPETLKVSPDTYANCCQFAFNSSTQDDRYAMSIRIFIGPNKGLLFKNIELILGDHDQVLEEFISKIDR